MIGDDDTGAVRQVVESADPGLGTAEYECAANDCGDDGAPSFLAGYDLPSAPVRRFTDSFREACANDHQLAGRVSGLKIYRY